MKCEICHEADAAEAITRQKNGSEEELYVCRACAETERKKRQKKSQRTRKSPHVTEISATFIDGDKPPPFLSDLMNLVNGIVGDLENAKKESEERQAEKNEPELTELSLDGVRSSFRVGGRLHLEGLFIIGDLPAVERGVRALGMKLEGVDADGIHDAGHVYKIKCEKKDANRAKRLLSAILEQEENARNAIYNEMPRVFGDSLCRALAILKNCRMLSPAEAFDMLSPLRLAALEGLLDGITLKKINELENTLDLSGNEDSLAEDDRDAVDAERADKMNDIFEDVVLNERAEERFM